LRELLSRPVHKVSWISTKQMLADALTKDMAADYLRCRLSTGLWSLKEDSTVAKLLPRKGPKTLEEIEHTALLMDTLSKQKKPVLRCPTCRTVHVEPDAAHRYFRGKDLWKPHSTHVCSRCRRSWKTPKPTLGYLPASGQLTALDQMSTRATCHSGHYQ
jgi:hypothetical protein